MYTFKMLYMWERNRSIRCALLVAVIDIDALSTQRTGVNPGEHNKKFPEFLSCLSSSTGSKKKIFALRQQGKILWDLEV